MVIVLQIIVSALIALLGFCPLFVPISDNRTYYNSLQ